MATPGFWQGKRVFLTGHTGFKGSWLSLWLEGRGAQVMGYSLEPPSRPSLFELSGLSERMRSVHGDVRDLDHLLREFSEFQPEIVLHMAAQSLVRPSYRDPVGTYSTNVMGTVHVLEAVRRTPSVRAVVNVTSDKCYENREWVWSYRENEAMGGYDPYSNSKGCSELVTAAYRQSFFGEKGARPLGLASVRAGNVIGGGDWAEDRLIPDCMRALLDGEPIAVRNPRSIRPWQHVLEPLSGYLRVAELLWTDPLSYSEGYNFGPSPSDAKPVAWIADALVRAWGAGARWEDVSQPNQPHEAHYLKLDCSLAQAKLGWAPRLKLEETLQWVAEWYRAYGRKESVLALTREQIHRYESLQPNQ